MKHTIEFDIDEENKHKLYEKLYDLFEKDDELFQIINIDKDLLNLKFENSGIETKVNQAREKVEKLLLKQTQFKAVYSLISEKFKVHDDRSKNFNDLTLLFYFHYLKEIFTGKQNSLELKLFIYIISKFIEGFSTAIIDGIQNATNDFKEKFNFINNFKNFINENEIEEYENEVIYLELNENDELMIGDESCIDRYNLDNFEDKYMMFDYNILNIKKKEGKIIMTSFAPLTEQELTDFKIPLSQLNPFKGVEMSKEIFDYISNSEDDESYKDKININDIQFIDFTKNNLNSTQNDSKIDQIIDENEQNLSVFSMIENEIEIFLKEEKTKEDEIYYRFIIVNQAFEILRKDIPIETASDHLLKNVTGYILSALGVVKSEEEHLESKTYSSYNKYLRQTVENALR